MRQKGQIQIMRRRRSSNQFWPPSRTHIHAYKAEISRPQEKRLKFTKESGRDRAAQGLEKRYSPPWFQTFRSEKPLSAVLGAPVVAKSPPGPVRQLADGPGFRAGQPQN